MTFDELTNDLMQKLKFCDCGLTACVLHLIYDFILLKESFDSVDFSPPLCKEWTDHCDIYRVKIDTLFKNNSKSSEWLLYYVLNSAGIFMHSLSVQSGWLYDKDFFQQLKKWKKMHDEKNEVGLAGAALI